MEPVTNPFSLSALWLMEPRAAQMLFEEIQHQRSAARPSFFGIEKDEKPYTVRNGVAVIDLAGVMTKEAGWWSWFFSGASTSERRAALRQAEEDSEVKAILLRIDSPGGEVAGTVDLAEEVQRVGKEKRVVAFVEDMACSAAYWVASQASEVVANNAAATVGSIGVVMAVRDSSEAAKSYGVKVHLVKTGTFKGAGWPGTEVTEEHLAQWQAEIDAIFSEFVDAVADGRKLKRKEVLALADGRCFDAKLAMSSGLVDRIDSFDNTLAALAASEPVKSGRKDKAMASLWDELKSRLGGEEAPKVAASSVATFPAASVEPKLHPVLDAALKAGIDTPEKLAALQSQAKASEGFLKELREAAKSEAIRAYGQELGVRISAAVDSLGSEEVRTLRDAWKTEADTKFRQSNGASPARQTAPKNLPIAAADASDEDAEEERIRAMVRKKYGHASAAK